MPSGVQITKMTVADPGIGFIIDLSQCTTTNGAPSDGVINTSKNMNILVIITDELANPSTGKQPQHRCEIDINAPIDINEKMVVVLPFNCAQFGSESSIYLQLWVRQQYDGNLPSVKAYSQLLTITQNMVFDVCTKPK